MLKYEQLKKHSEKYKNWCNYYTLKAIVIDDTPCISFSSYAQTSLYIFENDDFLVTSIAPLKKAVGEKCGMLSAMPFPVLLENTRTGYTLNGYKWINDHSHPLKFNKDGDCLNPPVQAEDTDAKRKIFNKFMLNWQKQICALIKMNPPETGNIPESLHHYEVFTAIPSIDLYNTYIDKKYYWTSERVTNDDKMRYIKDFRRKHQNELYAEWLEGNEPVIDTWIKENVKCEEPSQ